MDFDTMSWQIDLPLLAAFVWFAWVGSVTPGPNCTLALATAANFGARSVRAHMLGVAIGFGSMLALALLGAHGLLQASPVLASLLKWFGIGYLIWLGLMLVRARGLQEGRVARPPRVHESAALQLANPKAWMLMTATVGAYQDMARPAWLNGTLIVAIFLACCTLALLIWAWVGARLTRWLMHERRLAVFNGVLGASLIVTAIWLAFA